ncbi:MAG: hypothetical protein WC694_03025, partial [Candidatus Paceibacterota bacterium]
SLSCPKFGIGAKGQAVKIFQTQLNAQGANLKADGFFGPLTKATAGIYCKSSLTNPTLTPLTPTTSAPTNPTPVAATSAISQVPQTYWQETIAQPCQNSPCNFSNLGDPYATFAKVPVTYSINKDFNLQTNVNFSSSHGIKNASCFVGNNAVGLTATSRMNGNTLECTLTGKPTQEGSVQVDFTMTSNDYSVTVPARTCTAGDVVLGVHCKAGEVMPARTTIKNNTFSGIQMLKFVKCATGSDCLIPVVTPLPITPPIPGTLPTTSTGDGSSWDKPKAFVINQTATKVSLNPKQKIYYKFSVNKANTNLMAEIAKLDVNTQVHLLLRQNNSGIDAKYNQVLAAYINNNAWGFALNPGAPMNPETTPGTWANFFQASSSERIIISNLISTGADYYFMLANEGNGIATVNLAVYSN